MYFPASRSCVELGTQSAIEFRYDCVAGRLAKVESLTEFPFQGMELSKMLFIQPYNANGVEEVAREMTQELIALQPI